MSTRACPSQSWCNEDHLGRHSSDDFHIKTDRRPAVTGVLRADLVLDAGKASVDINESVDWSIPLSQMPAFINEMRKELDRIEAAALAFTAVLHPLRRATEPGEPDYAGIGGGM